jgi:hypothetical protein
VSGARSAWFSPMRSSPTSAFSTSGAASSVTPRSTADAVFARAEMSPSLFLKGTDQLLSIVVPAKAACKKKVHWQKESGCLSITLSQPRSRLTVRKGDSLSPRDSNKTKFNAFPASRNFHKFHRFGAVYDRALFAVADFVIADSLTCGGSAAPIRCREATARIENLFEESRGLAADGATEPAIRV